MTIRGVLGKFLDWLCMNKIVTFISYKMVQFAKKKMFCYDITMRNFPFHFLLSFFISMVTLATPGQFLHYITKKVIKSLVFNQLW